MNRIEVVIVDAIRTPIGKFGGALKDVEVERLGATVIKGLLNRNKLEADLVQEVIMGNVLPTGSKGGNPSRIASLTAGLPVEVPAWTVNINCGSGLFAINQATQSIENDNADIIIAGGMENMSKGVFVSKDTRWGARLKSTTLEDSILMALYDPIVGLRMDQTAENLAASYNITREEQDEFAVLSHNRAESAIKSGRFNDEIIEVDTGSRKSPIFNVDEHCKFNANFSEFSLLKPAFDPQGTVTAGNASGLNDAASAVLLMSAEKARELELKPLGKILSYATTGVDPSIMGIGPVSASQKALEKSGLSIGDIDLFEINEAFAAQVLAVKKELDIDIDKLNVNGGAIALGHPVSASGSRLVTTLLYELKKRRKRYGLASLCIGGGQGVAAVIEAFLE